MTSGRATGSREPDPSGSGPPGFDPAREDDAILLMAACIQANKLLKEAWSCAAWGVHSKDGRTREFMARAAVLLAETKRIINAAPDLAIAMEARQGGDGETRLHPKDDSAGRQASPGTGEGTDHG